MSKLKARVPETLPKVPSNSSSHSATPASVTRARSYSAPATPLFSPLVGTGSWADEMDRQSEFGQTPRTPLTPNWPGPHSHGNNPYAYHAPHTHTMQYHHSPKKEEEEPRVEAIHPSEGNLGLKVLARPVPAAIAQKVDACENETPTEDATANAQPVAQDTQPPVVTAHMHQVSPQGHVEYPHAHHPPPHMYPQVVPPHGNDGLPPLHFHLIPQTQGYPFPNSAAGISQPTVPPPGWVPSFPLHAPPFPLRTPIPGTHPSVITGPGHVPVEIGYPSHHAPPTQNPGHPMAVHATQPQVPTHAPVMPTGGPGLHVHVGFSSHSQPLPSPPYQGLPSPQQHAHHHLPSPAAQTPVPPASFPVPHSVPTPAHHSAQVNGFQSGQPVPSPHAFAPQSTPGQSVAVVDTAPRPQGDLSPAGLSRTGWGRQFVTRPIQDQEEQLVQLTIQFLESPYNNPNQGSVPAESIHNNIKSGYPDLYQNVVGTRHNSWRRFIERHPEVFHMFQQEAGKWRIRLLSHQHWAEADRKQQLVRQSNDGHVLQCLINYLTQLPSHSCKVDEFIEAYPDLPENVGSDPDQAVALPKRGDLVRFVRKHSEYLGYDGDEKVISLKS
eukprot:TRINITY_DN14240_c0_g1_i1.p1 TRINITY_DN14240_c0_g1~~TRINITY_DN14240_c0_g1_i1.p1  ORF type:complete len:607 (-),score=38.66 TRINITY_DN14240_c0_g1_i1:192-2012(-)